MPPETAENCRFWIDTARFLFENSSEIAPNSHKNFKTRLISIVPKPICGQTIFVVQKIWSKKFQAPRIIISGRSGVCVGGGWWGVCKVIIVSNPTRLRLGYG